MKQKSLILILGIIFLSSITFSHGVKKTGIGIMAGFTTPIETNYKADFMYGANIHLAITKNIAIELRGLRFQSDVTGITGSLSDGKLSIIPIQLSLQGRIPNGTDGKFAPYVTVGGGYYLYNFSTEAGAAWNNINFEIEEKIKNSFGFHLGGGIDFFFKRGIVFYTDFRYCIVKTTGTWTLLDRITNTTASGDIEGINLNVFILGAGLKVLF